MLKLFCPLKISHLQKGAAKINWLRPPKDMKDSANESNESLFLLPNAAYLIEKICGKRKKVQIERNKACFNC